MAILHVTANRNGNQLTLTDQQINLHHGDLLQWHFPDLSLNQLAFIHFPFQENRPFGPFQFLEPSSFHVRGLGNTGHPGEYHYTAFVLDDHGVVASSDGSASVVNHSAEVDTSPDATIQCNGETLIVTPDTLQVEIGRTAVWYITGLPPGYFVTFQFPNFPDTMVGPFSSFQMSRGFGNAQVATGTQFAGPADSHQQYLVSLRRPDGTVVDFRDPVIEPPPGWPPTAP
jgi:hypothetical protein